MEAAELREVVARGEDSYVEFKEESAHPDDLAATIVAFANTDGGRLILGVADEKQIPGSTDADRLMQRVDNICAQNVQPPGIIPFAARFASSFLTAELKS